MNGGCVNGGDGGWMVGGAWRWQMDGLTYRWEKTDRWQVDGERPVSKDGY